MSSFLTFSGNCREAMHFYQSCLGGELHFQSLDALPGSGSTPPKMKKAVVHASLTDVDFMLMASDLPGDDNIVYGNALTIVLQCSDKDELKQKYKSLSQGGETIKLPAPTVWGTIIGLCSDKFGFYWMLYCMPETAQKNG